MSLARTHGSQDLDTIWSGSSTTPTLIGDGFVDFLGRQLRPAPLGQLHGQPGAAAVATASSCTRAVRDKWGRPVAYIVKDWHAHDRT